MNDRYLFRGKRIDDGEWITGCLSKLPEGMFIFAPDKVLYGNEYREASIDPATVGQCVDLCDKNGMLIFEGDIISARTIDEHEELEPDIFSVVFDNLRWETRSPVYADLELADYASEYIALEIIGNIHDNPELMEAPQ